MGTDPPIKQRPYRVSNAEVEIMEAEIDQYLEFDLLRLSYPSGTITPRLETLQGCWFYIEDEEVLWGRDQIAFLGHIVTPTGILPNPEKVKAIMNAARPQAPHTVHTFLGFTSYFRRRIIEPTILVYPDFSHYFKLYVDSSRLAVEAYLMQTVDGGKRVVAYASKLLVGSEKNWIYKTDGTSENECWGIVWATRKFRCYLDRTEFGLYTDHKALVWVFNENTRTTNAKLARWAMELS
ncbi:unnamed protein product [Phytophthora fragariaefolia]|uniref:Unnamed protein product n=1 Tax=Phytophthora fragariaefolia TaxID=1490495 RepID=A0A9W6WZ88_9STRA|nr:unnamed protein product [Phytophthora fragariaefolia]